MLLSGGFVAYAAVSPGRRCFPWSCRWFCHDSITECHTRRSPGIPDRSAAVRVERRRSVGLLITEVRPCDATSSGTALAEDESADRLQTGSSRLPLPQRPSSVVPRQRPPACGGPRRPAASSLGQQAHSSCLRRACQLSVTVRFRWLYGTVCRPMSLRRHHCRHSRDG